MNARITDHEPIVFEDVWPQIDKVPGWLSPGQEKCLFDLVKSLPNSAKILELGCYLGRSTTAMAFACKSSNRQIYCVDSFKGNDSDFVNGQHEISWEGDDFMAVYEANISSNNLFDYVHHFKCLTTEIAPFWVRKVDMIFIDAGHTYDAVLEDYEAFSPFVKTGGIIALHDVTPGWPEVKKVWDEAVSPQLKNIGNVGSLAFGTKI